MRPDTLPAEMAHHARQTDREARTSSHRHFEMVATSSPTQSQRSRPFGNCGSIAEAQLGYLFGYLGPIASSFAFVWRKEARLSCM